jgi:hypothetical protein
LLAVVPAVAREERVPADALANYIAHRLAEKGHDWWWAAERLQDRSEDPYGIARQMFLRHARLDAINEADRALLVQALTDAEG